MYRQFLLSKPYEKGVHFENRTLLRAWLKDSPELQVGTRVTLKEEEGLWHIDERSEMTLPASPASNWRTWDVGGIEK